MSTAAGFAEDRDPPRESAAPLPPAAPQSAPPGAPQPGPAAAPHPAVGDAWQLRAADADREAYVDILAGAYVAGRLSRAEYDERLAAALAATTYAQLRPLVADLPVDPAQLPQPPVLAAGPPRPAPAAGRLPVPAPAVQSAPVVAVLSESRRVGGWAVESTTTAVAVLGSVTLDLTTARFCDARPQIRANAILGSVEITVPDDIAVECSGVGVLGEFGHKDAADQPDTADVVLTITGVALLGSVTVTTVPGPPTDPDRPRLLPADPDRPGLLPPGPGPE